MPQARLPDVNTAFIMYRREAIVSLKSFDHRGSWGALNCINALLPDKYRVVLDNDRFKDETRITFIYCCGKCNEQTDKKDIDIYDKFLNSLEILTSDKTTIEVWKCPKCYYINNRIDTNIIKDELGHPSFLHTIPLPPKRKNGLLGRAKYRKEFTAWAWNFLYELEERMAQFRDDNWSKESEYKESDVDTSEEEGLLNAN